MTAAKSRSGLVRALARPHRQVWKAAQLFFSLCISVALFSQSPFGLPFAVIGFWKFGFPETAGCFRRAFREGKVNLTSIAAYMNGVGTLIHHCSGALLIVACTTHLMPLDRRVLSMSMPLVAQHLVVLFRYSNKVVYGLTELALEICWEWEILANIGDLSLENGYDITTRGICISMIFAHWCYWGAALLSINTMFKKSASDNMRQLAKDLSFVGIDYEGFVEALQKNGITTLGDEQVREIFALADRDHSGTLDYAEVEILIKELALMSPATIEDVEDVFEVSSRNMSPSRPTSPRVGDAQTRSHPAACADTAPASPEQPPVVVVQQPQSPVPVPASVVPVPQHLPPLSTYTQPQTLIAHPWPGGGFPTAAAPPSSQPWLLPPLSQGGQYTGGLPDGFRPDLEHRHQHDHFYRSAARGRLHLQPYPR